MIDFNSHAFQVIHKTSGFGLMPEWQGTRSDKRFIQHWPLNDPSVNHPDAFLWYFFPKNRNNLDEGFWIINKQSGFALMPEWQGTRQDKRAVQNWPSADPSIDHPHGILWKLEQVGQHYKLVNLQSNFGLMPEWQGTRSDARSVQHWPLNDTAISNRDAFLWAIKPVQEIRVGSRTLGQRIEARDVKLTSSVFPKPPTRSEGILEVHYIPFVSVTDTERTTEWKLEHSPYYLLEREGVWVTTPERFFVNNSSTQDTKTFTIRRAWTKAQKDSFSSTVSVSATAGGDVEGGSVTSTVSFTIGFEESLSRTEEKEVSTTMPIAPHTAKALFSHENHLRLLRADRTLVKEWVVYDGEGSSGDFPLG